MGPLGTVLAVVFVISFMTFVTFFGRLPALRNTPIAGLHRLLWVHTPNALYSIDQRLTSGKVTGSVSRLTNHLMYDRHPTVVIFFILVMSVGECLFMPQAWSHITWFTKLTAVIAIILPYLFLYLSCAADPGYVTQDTLAHHMSLYPYDYALFHPGRVCRTCNIVKPPRSKHCSVCKRCVARSDHHCIFINGCVGYGNHHWFVLLLLSTAVLTSYGGLLGLTVVSSHLKKYHPAWSLWRPKTMSWKKYLSVWGLGIRGNVSIGASTLLALLISPLVWGLLLYTLYLIYCGTTTNESLKWSEWKEDITDGYAFSRDLPADRPKERYGEPGWTRWPAETDRIMVTTNDAMPPRPEQMIPGVGKWERVASIRDVVNLYDLGFWDNLREIFLENPFEHKDEEPTSERRGELRGTRRDFLRRTS